MKKTMKNLEAKSIKNTQSIKGGNFVPPVLVPIVVAGDNIAAPGHVMA